MGNGGECSPGPGLCVRAWGRVRTRPGTASPAPPQRDGRMPAWQGGFLSHLGLVPTMRRGERSLSRRAELWLHLAGLGLSCFSWLDSGPLQVWLLGWGKSSGHPNEARRPWPSWGLRALPPLPEASLQHWASHPPPLAHLQPRGAPTLRQACSVLALTTLGRFSRKLSPCGFCFFGSVLFIATTGNALSRPENRFPHL